MKKIYTLFVLALMTVAFSSCEDEQIARTLEGTWQGDMFISSNYNGRVYDATSTEITFLKDPATYSSGSGYWVDYYSNAPWDYVANHIDWTVDRRTIYIRFIEEGTRMEIRDYRLSSNSFYGTIYENGHTVDFDLVYVSRPASYYSSYRWGYDAWGYYARTRSNTDIQPAEKPYRFVNPHRND